MSRIYENKSDLLYSYLILTWRRLVEETLEPLDPDRRAFRLVGGVLVRLFLWGVSCIIPFLTRYSVIWNRSFVYVSTIPSLSGLFLLTRWNALFERYYQL